MSVSKDVLDAPWVAILELALFVLPSRASRGLESPGTLLDSSFSEEALAWAAIQGVL